MSYNEELRRAIEQGREDFARTVNDVMARAGISSRMSPDGGIYRDYDSMSAQQFLVEITNPFAPHADREGAHSAFLASNERNNPVPAAELSAHRKRWLQLGIGMLATEEQTQQADDVLGMIAAFHEVIENDRAEETREEAGTLAFWEDYWSRLQSSPLSDPNTISRANRYLDFLRKQRTRFGL